MKIEGEPDERGSPRPKKRRSCHSCGPFLVGLIIGLILSSGLRYLSNPCWRHGLVHDKDYHMSSSIVPTNSNNKNNDGNSLIKTDMLTGGNDNDVMENQNQRNLNQQQQLLMDSYDEKISLSSNNKYLQQSQEQIETLSDLLPVHSAFNVPDADKEDILLRSSSSRATLLSSSSSTLPSAGKSPWKTSQKNLLLVGVMTAQKYLNNRAIGVFETWAQQIPGKVIFFTGADTLEESGHRNWKSSTNFTLVSLEGVDDSYPPQKKSFKMLKYMHDNYGDDYEWFLRADDDVYIKADKLSEFLRSINSRQLYFIGQAGKGNGAEIGTLNLAHNENFCMGGPGIILSRVALAKVAPFVEHCLQEMYSTHEDVEIGRCVQRFAGISCTWAYEMQSIFYHNSSGDEAFTDNLKRREVHRAITLHPVKDYRHMYRLHSYVQSLAIQDLIYESLLIQRELLALPNLNSSRFTSTTQSNSDGDMIFNKTSGHDQQQHVRRATDDPEDIHIYGLPPSLNRFKPSAEGDIIPWAFLSPAGVYSDSSQSPKMKVESSLKEALEDVIREMMDLINGYSRIRGRIIDFKEILYGYHRVNPFYGHDFILDLLMTYKKYRGKKMTVPVRRHAYIQRSFSPLQLRFLPNQYPNPDSHSSSKTPLHEVLKEKESEKDNFNPVKVVLILPLSGRVKAFERFLQSYQSTCDDFRRTNMEMGVKVGPTKNLYSLNLIVVHFNSADENEEQQSTSNLVESFRNRNAQQSSSSDSSKTSQNNRPLNAGTCSIEKIQSNEVLFSRSIAMETGISRCNEDDLLFLIDVDIRFSIQAVQRVLLNTIQGKQVYFPIVFSQYNPMFQSTDLARSHLERKSYNVNNNTSGDEEDTEISEDTGYWRSYGFGIAAFFKSDYRTAGGFDTSIKGWGKEDVSLYNQFIANTTLKIFRAPDPQLIHIYHEFHCDSQNLTRSQYTMCLGSEANSLGSSKNLMKYIFQHRPAGHIKRFLEHPVPSPSSTLSPISSVH